MKYEIYEILTKVYHIVVKLKACFIKTEVLKIMISDKNSVKLENNNKIKYKKALPTEY